MCISGHVSWGEGLQGGRTWPPSAFWLIEGKGATGMGRGPPVSHVEEGQHCPLPQAHAFTGGYMPDHPALFLPGFVLHEHQGDVALQDSTDEPGHSKLRGREEPEGHDFGRKLLGSLLRILNPEGFLWRLSQGLPSEESWMPTAWSSSLSPTGL